MKLPRILSLISETGAHNMKVFILIACLTSFSTFAQLAPSSGLASLDKDGQPQIPKYAEILDKFSEVYKERNKPTFVVFWNKQYTDKISDWEMAPTQQEYIESVKGQSKEDRFSADYSSTSRSILKKNDTKRRSPSEVDYSSFQTKLIETLTLADVVLIDRASIMRLTGNEDLSKQIPDSKRIETKALSSHGDYLLEVLFIPAFEHPLKFKASAEVKDIKTGQLITRVLSKPPVEEDIWIATENGYTKYKQFKYTPSFEQMAEEVSMALLEKLSVEM